eukprot:Nitzschia sp. Nitz4//scaffold208_size52459//8037//9942//NITZ4_006806-RA/size52459-augustus-gene-0.0-mRNA-1//1//CDS//3329541639//7638//frame0
MATEPEIAPVAEPVVATEEGAAETNGDSKPKRDNRKRDERPIEELYDLTQPIPKVDKPSKEEHEAALTAINEEFEKLKAERAEIQSTIEGLMGQKKGSEMGKQRELLQGLRKKKGGLIEEKNVIRAQLDSLRAAGDKLAKDRKDSRSAVKFTSIEDIDKEIKKLERLQETTSMSLTEEKKLIKEIDALKASKDKIKGMKDTEAGIEDIKLKRKMVQDQISAKDKEIDAVSKEIDEHQKVLKSMSEQETDKRGALDGLFKKRDELKKTIADKLKEKDALRDEFREKNNAWYNFKRAISAQKKMQYEAEKKKREEEKAAYLAKLEEEENKKIPYEEEQGLCDYLADYLERTYIKGGDDSKAVSAKKEEVIAVKDDPFAGFKPVNKKDEDEYFGKGKGAKKKRQRAPKKAEGAGPFTLNVDSFEQFGLLGLNPPTSLAEVEGSIKALREKKEWYKQQPRGSVPTAKDIRKQNEAAAAKLRQGGDASTASGSQGRKGGKFDLSSTEEFVPLGKGATNAVDASSWGSKPVAAAEEVQES